MRFSWRCRVNTAVPLSPCRMGEPGVALGDGLDVRGADDLDVVAVVVLQDLQGVTALILASVTVPHCFRPGQVTDLPSQYSE